MTGVASFKETDFFVSVTGAVSLTRNVFNKNARESQYSTHLPSDISSRSPSYVSAPDMIRTSRHQFISVDHGLTTVSTGITNINIPVAETFSATVFTENTVPVILVRGVDYNLSEFSNSLGGTAEILQIPTYYHSADVTVYSHMGNVYKNEISVRKFLILAGRSQTGSMSEYGTIIKTGYSPGDTTTFNLEATGGYWALVAQPKEPEAVYYHVIATKFRQIYSGWTVPN
jgi:hypothetical protein